MALKVGSRVRIIDEDRYGRILFENTDSPIRGDFTVRCEDVPWDDVYFESELEEVPEVGAEPVIVRYLTYNGNGGLEWVNYLEYSSKYDTTLAFGWSDGLMTWVQRRDV